jgi:hypothetical protein
MSSERAGLSINPLACPDERNISVYSASLPADTPSDRTHLVHRRGSVSLLNRSFSLIIITPKEAAHAG